MRQQGSLSWWLGNISVEGPNHQIKIRQILKYGVLAEITKI